ncbi:ATP-binding protein [Kribbella albertanoniae]|uniref:ATP-binding protein n=1 Tax=Kribbella albertanoniae TaxID=1266829 RepID=A0A4R4QC13_9ACTN|nr:ATP-binding protein [Kribbella albertanoniae]
MNRTLERYGVWLRSTVVALCSALGVVSADRADMPLATALLAPALLACGVRLYTLRRPLPSAALGMVSLLWLADGSVVVLTGLSQPVLGGDVAEMMVEAIIGICIITFQHEWATRPWAGAALGVLGAAACELGDILSGHSPDAMPLLRLAVLGALSRAAYLIVRARARAADRSAALSAAARREAEVAAARRAAEREYLATLHDTASATLLMVSQGDGRDWSWLPARARQDLEALSAVPAFGTGSVDLAALLACVPAGEGPARVRLTTTIDSPLVIPSGPALAIFNGVREAVSNVSRHAGVREAELRAWRADDDVVVELTDAGRGFDPESVPPRRRGIKGSIIGRMQAVGGSAAITSLPGNGTRVQWRWHAPAQQLPAGTLQPPRARARTALVQLIRKQLLHGAQLAALLISLFSQFTLSLHRLVSYQDVYRPAWAQTAAFGCLAAVAGIGAFYLLRGKQIPPPVRWCSLGAVLAVSVIGAFTLPPDRLAGAADWSFGLVGWYALFLLADLRLRWFAAFLGVHVGITVIVVLLAGAPTTAEAIGLGIRAISDCGFQLSVGFLLTRLLHGTAPAAGIAAEQEEELRTRERIQEDMQRDHKDRYRALTATTVPLLVGLGHGVLSPHDEEVRLRCGVEAARMRRLFAESDAVSDALLNEVRACIEVAEHQGVTVSLAVRGRPAEVPVSVRRELVDPVAVTLGRTRSTARVTVVWTPGAVRVSVVSEDGATRQTAEADKQATDVQVTVVRTTRGASVWVEASWRQPALARVA